MMGHHLIGVHVTKCNITWANTWTIHRLAPQNLDPRLAQDNLWIVPNQTLYLTYMTITELPISYILLILLLSYVHSLWGSWFLSGTVLSVMYEGQLLQFIPILQLFLELLILHFLIMSDLNLVFLILNSEKAKHKFDLMKISEKVNYKSDSAKPVKTSEVQKRTVK